MIPAQIKRIRPRAFTFGPTPGERPIALYVAVAVGAVVMGLGLWVVATMGTPPVQTPVTAELSIKI